MDINKIRKIYKILDEKFYIFIRATPQEIDVALGRNWTEKGLWFVNLSDEKDIDSAINMWNNRKILS